MTGTARMSDSADDVDLNGMTKAQLIEYAAAHGIGGVSSSMTKADIIAAITAAESE